MRKRGILLSVVAVLLVFSGTGAGGHGLVERWKAPDHESGGDLRALIDETLPLTGSKAKRYGVEVTLWETASRDRIWAARTDTYKRKEMRQGAGEFVQFVMQALKMSELL